MRFVVRIYEGNVGEEAEKQEKLRNEVETAEKNTYIKCNVSAS